MIETPSSASSPQAALMLGDRRHQDPPQLWPVVVAGSVVLHLVALVAMRFYSLEMRSRSAALPETPMAIELLEVTPEAGEPVTAAPPAAAPNPDISSAAPPPQTAPADTAAPQPLLGDEGEEIALPSDRQGAIAQAPAQRPSPPTPAPTPTPPPRSEAPAPAPTPTPSPSPTPSPTPPPTPDPPSPTNSPEAPPADAPTPSDGEGDLPSSGETSTETETPADAETPGEASSETPPESAEAPEPEPTQPEEPPAPEPDLGPATSDTRLPDPGEVIDPGDVAQAPPESQPEVDVEEEIAPAQISATLTTISQVPSGPGGVQRDVPTELPEPVAGRQQIFTLDPSAGTCALTPQVVGMFGQGQPVGMIVTVDNQSGRVLTEYTRIATPSGNDAYDQFAACIIGNWEFRSAATSPWSEAYVEVVVDRS
ncbi:hypothetical protein [Geitlerinema sp. PCC 7407]|uniref:hypothetical protein n=1 Tax=Geitlerinema sp. PCC 7407 TaxID=1173025 RepID=UPI00167FB624|nr:hypothetical protein [Geitlerinema sp. PCC 7407]